MTEPDDLTRRTWDACAELNGACSCQISGDRSCDSLRAVAKFAKRPVAYERARITAACNRAAR